MGAERETGTLYVVATPIGNLGDMSERAARILADVEVVAAEDTRTAGRLLAHLGITVPRLVSFFEGNEAARSDELVRALAQGQRVAVISEAGMPGISDPGERLVARAIAAGARVEVIPGPVAAVTALVGSGLPAARFLFLGFPPREPGRRRALFGQRRREPATLVLYEAPDRVAATLADLADALGPGRPAAVARELTKLHEEYVRGRVAELAERFAAAPPRGECTIVVAGADEDAAEAEIDVEAELARLLGEGLGPKDASARLVVKTGLPRRRLYQLALSLMRDRR